ncbi:MAG: hypothetical protein H6722_35145, partial [Sandaracinus sp.]|nr:hypothetical protein [Sandaracinus sp.]
MKRALFVLTTLFVLPQVASAHEYYATRVPRTATATNSVGTERPCITCHDNADGGAGCETTGGT